MKKILVSLMAMVLAVGLVGAGAFAYFNDTETSSGNTFTAGTLDLTVDGKDDPSVVSIQVSNIKPADGFFGSYSWRVKNTGSLPGLLWFEVTPIINNENGLEEPEYNPITGVYAPGEDGTDLGELGAYIIVGKLNVYDGSTRLRIGSPSGPEFAHGTHSLNYMGGLKLYSPTGSTYDILDPGEDEELCLVLKLPSTVGNCVQGDSVKFNIIFHLDQMP